MNFRVIKSALYALLMNEVIQIRMRSGLESIGEV